MLTDEKAKKIVLEIDEAKEIIQEIRKDLEKEAKSKRKKEAKEAKVKTEIEEEKEKKEEEKKKAEREFSSHTFIEKYAYHHEKIYIEMLCAHKNNKAFQTVHRKIGRFLSDNKDDLGIEKSERKKKLNVFGHETEVQFWIIKS